MIGHKGSSEFIRLFKGGKKEGMVVFKKFSKNGKLIKKNTYPGEMFTLSDGTLIGYRSVSTSGPPTIDIKLSNSKDYIKLKFID